MKNLLIVGCGNIGFRHLQGTLEYLGGGNEHLTVYCVDKDKEALDRCLAEAASRNILVRVTSEMSSLPKSIELAIIATASAVRREVFDQLVSVCNIKYIIFEKVLFQKVEDYHYVKKKLHELHICAWVNCPRRGMELWHTLKGLLEKEETYEICISGGNWGLCCNTVHYLDAICYLTENTKMLQIKKMKMDGPPVAAKRVGYKEAYGTILGSCGKCTGFTISCQDDSSALLCKVIGKRQYVIDETRGELTVLESGHEVQKLHFQAQYVSHLTGIFVREILEQGDCELTTFEDSVIIHEGFIERLGEYFAEYGYGDGSCPIT